MTASGLVPSTMAGNIKWETAERKAPFSPDSQESTSRKPVVGSIKYLTSSLRVVGLHALRNALIPVVTVIGLQIGVLFTGAILTETIFSWPGVGKWLVEAIGRRDYPVLQGGILLIGTMVMAVNLLVDITYGIINPRIRHQR